MNILEAPADKAEKISLRDSYLLMPDSLGEVDFTELSIPQLKQVKEIVECFDGDLAIAMLIVISKCITHIEEFKRRGLPADQFEKLSFKREVSTILRPIKRNALQPNVDKVIKWAKKYIPDEFRAFQENTGNWMGFDASEEPSAPQVSMPTKREPSLLTYVRDNPNGF